MQNRKSNRHAPRTAAARTAITLAAALLTANALVATGCGPTDNDRQSSAEQPAAPAIPLDAAIVRGDDNTVRDHIDAGTPVNTPNATGDTPLSLAAVFGRAYAAEALVSAGAELETRNNSGTTPLFNAAFFCHPEVVRILIDAGADTDTTDRNGIPLKQIMETPWEQIEPVYSAVYSAIGMPLDAERIKSSRPQIAAMLR